MNINIIERNGDITEQVSCKKMKLILGMLHTYFKGTFKWNSLIDNQSSKHVSEREEKNKSHQHRNDIKTSNVEKLSEVNIE